MTFEDTKEGLKNYLLQALNMVLDAAETSYTNSFDISISPNGFYWLPRLPSSFIINFELYERIFEIANIALYPRYTLLKQNGMYIVPLDSNDIHVQRALFFPWMPGIPERLTIPNLNFEANKNHTFPLMKNLNLDYDSVTSIAIAGTSGSGKSYFLNYLLSTIHYFSKLTVIDPKMDQPARWARDNNVEVIYPDASRSKADFVNEINEVLANALHMINDRQRRLYVNPQLQFDHYTIAIDEVLALGEGIPKSIKNAFNSLISQIALLGRATKVHLLLVSQRFDFNTLPPSVREQANVLIQLGHINSKTTQFLFPDIDPKGIVIPLGKGTGLIQIIDSEHPAQVLPFLAPTYSLSKGDKNE